MLILLRLHAVDYQDSLNFWPVDLRKKILLGETSGKRPL